MLKLRRKLDRGKQTISWVDLKKAKEIQEKETKSIIQIRKFRQLKIETTHV